MEKIKITIAANITYSCMTYNTPLHVEYEHTGEFTYKQGKKRFKTDGYYFIKRLAIPNHNGGIWYINNEGDSYTINKVSKYARKKHAEICKEPTPIKL